MAHRTRGHAKRKAHHLATQHHATPSNPAPLPEKRSVGPAVPGRIEYGGPPGSDAYVDEDAMRGQPDYGSTYGPLGSGPNYPASNYPSTSIPVVPGPHAKKR